MGMKTIYYFAVWCINSVRKWFVELFKSKAFRGILVWSIGGAFIGMCFSDLFVIALVNILLDGTTYVKKAQ